MRTERPRKINPVRRFALILLIAAVAVVVPLSTAGTAFAANGDISLSSNVERLNVRPCLPEATEVGITNHTRKGRFVDVYVTAESPLRSSKPNVTTYVPAGGTVHVAVRISAPIDAPSGDYAIRFDANTAAPLVIPASVVNPPDVRCLPHESLTATATSAQVSPDYGPWLAVDGAESTLWHTRYSPVRDVLPQSITVDLGTAHDVAELVYVPRTSGNLNGTITSYVVYGSVDGQSFSQLSKGSWPADRVRKSVALDTTDLRYIRLEALEGYGGYASASELVFFARTS